MTFESSPRPGDDPRSTTTGPTRLHRCGVCLALVITFGLASADANNVLERREYEIKAGFMFNFIRFVEWPKTPAGGLRPVRLCVRGTELVGDVFVALDWKPIRGGAVEVTRIARPEQAVACDVVFIVGLDAESQQEVLQAVAGAPTSTVGEAQAFTKAGGMIAFVYRKNQLRFAVNLDPVARAGMTIRSDLLRLAADVSRAGGGH